MDSRCLAGHLPSSCSRVGTNTLEFCPKLTQAQFPYLSAMAEKPEVAATASEVKLPPFGELAKQWEGVAFLRQRLFEDKKNNLTRWPCPKTVAVASCQAMALNPRLFELMAEVWIVSIRAFSQLGISEKRPGSELKEKNTLCGLKVSECRRLLGQKSDPALTQLDAAGLKGLFSLGLRRFKAQKVKTGSLMVNLKIGFGVLFRFVLLFMPSTSTTNIAAAQVNDCWLLRHPHKALGCPRSYARAWHRRGDEDAGTDGEGSVDIPAAVLARPADLDAGDVPDRGIHPARARVHRGPAPGSVEAGTGTAKLLRAPTLRMGEVEDVKVEDAKGSEAEEGTHKQHEIPARQPSPVLSIARS